MSNCITTILKLEGMGKLQNTMFLFCTNNSTIEKALYKGTGNSPKLLELSLSL